MIERRHENDPLYGWSPAHSEPADPYSMAVPVDLVQYYRQFKLHSWGYVCPCCKNVWAPGFGGMPESFRAHLRDWLEGKGCFFSQKAPVDQKLERRSQPRG